jgi:hypothetical protein
VVDILASFEANRGSKAKDLRIASGAFIHNS